MALTRRTNQLLGAGIPNFDINFDKGSAQSIQNININTIRITPKKHWSGLWAWYAIRSAKLAGRNPTFLINNANHYGLSTGMILGCWSNSLDSDTWNYFSNMNIGVDDISISNNTPFPSGMIYISHFPLYPFARIQRKVGEWLAHPLVSDTASTTNGIISYSTSRNAQDGSNRIVPALPYYGFKISSGAGSKNKVVVAAYNHPSETQGPFALERFVDWILEGSSLATFLLNYNDVYLYPCVNPQGVWAGYFRCSPESTTDHNRLWNVLGSNDDVDAIRGAINADTGGTIEVGLDFHGWMETWARRGYSSEPTEATHVAFKDLMLRYDPGFINVLSDTASMLQVVFKSVFNARLHYSIEHGVSANHGVSDYKLFGENNAKTLALLTACGYLSNGPAVGSRNFNGITDRIDRASAGNLTAHALTISMWVKMSGVPASGNGYLMAIHDAGNVNYGIVISYDNNRVSFVVRGASSYMNHYCDGSGGGQTFPIVNTGWTQVLITWDGVFDASHVHCYRNGIERLGGNSNTTGETTHTGSWSIGGRIMDDTRNAIGNISHFRVFDRVLSPTEIALEANGELTTESGLLCWFKGTTSSLVDSKDGVSWTLDGTTHQTGAGKGPPIITT